MFGSHVNAWILCGCFKANGYFLCLRKVMIIALRESNKDFAQAFPFFLFDDTNLFYGYVPLNRERLILCVKQRRNWSFVVLFLSTNKKIHWAIGFTREAEYIDWKLQAWHEVWHKFYVTKIVFHSSHQKLRNCFVFNFSAAEFFLIRKFDNRLLNLNEGDLEEGLLAHEVHQDNWRQRAV